MRTTELVAGFRQSTPYVNAHRGKTFVVMLGGEAVDQPGYRSIINDVALLTSLGIKIVLVFGARPQFDSALSQAGLQSEFHNEIRVTESESLQIIKQVSGAMQLDITAMLSMSLCSTPMSGNSLNVVSGNFVIAQPLGIDDGVDYHHSGRVRRIDVDGIRHQLDNNSIVLLGPISASVTGESFNLTAEEIATQVALKLDADKMIGFCHEAGILDENGEAIAELMPNEAVQLLAKHHSSSEICKSAAAFLNAAIEACRGGVHRCHLVSYKEDGALLQELFSLDGIGTQIAPQSSEQLRSATISDINGVLNLIRPLEEQGYLVRRSREQLEMEIEQFSVIERDGLIIACAALYAFPEEEVGEFASLAVHPQYRDADRGSFLLRVVINKARKQGYKALFALTTRSIHWFLEQGFDCAAVDDLPAKKKSLYNYQRRSKILKLDLTRLPKNRHL
ncbi:amino-acid N-acetyltransferase [Pseudoalteromonas luteoviolacea]|uniref:Amino-acid acetyltransferase n=1 Tax=Pseudoalteromonas luteoviolacea TaxID=43657 RepID=A0A1C0TPI5_9GAMM|nr:amino-acid N-acetyltransferase [Pseudoalteromonas luteoviolacea]MBQ4811806.1 amino-acid N-acetyltransferase [Pseudoalteromonas luteoviolacea]OCQ20849.1 amino-acid N-acetyltransferase [Pseudoalteromonas luteoviolacea]